MTEKDAAKREFYIPTLAEFTSWFEGQCDILSLAPTTLGGNAARDPNLLQRLKDGKNVTLTKARDVFDFVEATKKNRLKKGGDK